MRGGAFGPLMLLSRSPRTSLLVLCRAGAPAWPDPSLEAAEDAWACIALTFCGAAMTLRAPAGAWAA
jgi:hypothetical protein